MDYLQRGGVYTIDYKNWTSFQNGVTSCSQSSTFSVSTQSLNKVLAFFTYGTGGGLDSLSETSTYFTRFAPSGCTHQFQINGIQKPTWQPTSEQSFLLINNILGHSHDAYGGSSPYLTSLTNWLDSFYCMGIQLDHNDPEYTSGLNTLGNTAASSWTTNGGTPAVNSSGNSIAPTNIVARIFVEVTSSLLIGQNRQIDIVW
jgi:hypothetical protein